MDLFTFLLCKKKGGGGGGLTYTLSADTVNKQIVLTPSEGDAQAITVPYATDASTVNGKDVPELENGKIPATYLPSYVDDVLEYEDLAHFPAEGEIGKIYIALDTSLIYRWGGSTYAEISQSLALGETEATAYRGDRGKIAYDHSQSAHAPSNAEANQNAFSNITVGDTTIEADSKTDTLTLEAGSNITLTPDASTDKVTITATDTTYSNATTSVSGLMSGSDKTKLDGIATGAEVNQNTFSNVKIGSTTVAADSKTDTLELEAGDNIELTPDSTNDKITISGIPVTRTIRDASIASFSDGGNAPIPSLTASIVPVQDLHGYDSPWAGGAGKNKFNPSSILQGTYNNTTNVWSITTPFVNKAIDMTFKENTQYTFSGKSKQGVAGKNLRLQIVYTDSTSTNLWETNTTDEVLFNVTSASGKSISAVNVNFGNAGGTVDITKFQIEEGTTATSFAPYSNICPISGWTEEVITRGGNSIWTGESSYNRSNAGYLSVADVALPAGTYTYVAEVSEVGKGILLEVFKNNSTTTANRIYQSNGIDTVIGANSFTFTLSEAGTNLRIYTNSASGITLNNIKLLSNPSTTTIPFTDGQGQSVEVFGGSVDVVNGVVTPCPYYASYNGEELTGEWISDRDVYAPNTTPTIGAQVVNIGATGTPFSVQPTSIKSLDGDNNVSASTGDVDVEYQTVWVRPTEQEEDAYDFKQWTR